MLRLAWYIRPIRFENSIRNRIGRPIRFEIRFERKKTICRSLLVRAVCQAPRSFYAAAFTGCRYDSQPIATLVTTSHRKLYNHLTTYCCPNLPNTLTFPQRLLLLAHLTSGTDFRFTVDLLQLLTVLNANWKRFYLSQQPMGPV